MTQPTSSPAQEDRSMRFVSRCRCGGSMEVVTPDGQSHFLGRQRLLVRYFWEVHSGPEHEPVDEDGYAWRSGKADTR